MLGEGVPMKHMSRRRLTLRPRTGWPWLISILILSGPAIAADKRGTSGRMQVQDASLAAATPVYDRKLHVAGNLRLGISNYGMIPGKEPYDQRRLDDNYPPITGCSPNFEFPAGTCSQYLYNGGLWVGG